MDGGNEMAEYREIARELGVSYSHLLKIVPRIQKQKPRVTREWVYETIDEIQDESFDRNHAHVDFKVAIMVLTKRLAEAGVEVVDES